MDELKTPQEMRAKAAELQQRASALEHAARLRSQAQNLSQEADRIEASLAPAAQQAQASKSQEGAEPETLDFRNPEHVARYVNAAYPFLNQ